MNEAYKYNVPIYGYFYMTLSKVYRVPISV